MNYKNKFYSKYVSTQTFHLYGEASLAGLGKQFPAWRSYFGKFLPENKNAAVIDLGCGNGGFVHWLQSLGYGNAQGIDVSTEQIEAGKKLGIKNIKQADIREFFIINSSEAKRYGAIFMRDVLEHFNREEILDILELVRESLENSGILVVQVPNAENLLWGRLRHGDFTHEISFTADSLKQILRLTGFQDVSVCPQRPVAYGLKSLIRAILWKFIELKIKFYLLIETGSSRGIFTQNLIGAARKK